MWNWEALQASKTVILCEALIVALTFWCAGYRYVTVSTHEYGLRQLGFSIHALEDYFSPPHRMQVMDWSRDGIRRHHDAEADLRPESAPVREALRFAKEYALLFSWMRRMAGSAWVGPAGGDSQSTSGIAWAYFGKFMYIEAATAP